MMIESEMFAAAWALTFEQGDAPLHCLFPKNGVGQEFGHLCLKERKRFER